MSKSELDEMQLQKRNMAGNQAFMLLYYLLFIDIGLNGMGFKWLAYPMNVIIIMSGCMGYYLIRIIGSNAYVGPRRGSKAIGWKTGVGVGTAIFMAGMIAYLFRENSANTLPLGNDRGAMMLFIMSIITLIITAVVSLIVKWQASGEE